MMALTESKTFNFELVSPERKLIAEPVTMAVIPGEEGDFGVLPNHSALVASVRPGIVEIFTEGQAEPRRIFIAGGFADVSATNCTVLAEEAVNVNDLNRTDLEQTIRNLREDIGVARDEAERARLEKRLALAQAKLEAVMGHTAH